MLEGKHLWGETKIFFSNNYQFTETSFASVFSLMLLVSWVTLNSQFTLWRIYFPEAQYLLFSLVISCWFCSKVYRLLSPDWHEVISSVTFRRPVTRSSLNWGSWTKVSVRSLPLICLANKEFSKHWGYVSEWDRQRPCSYVTVESTMIIYTIDKSQMRKK